ncbi:hypothetical protein FFWV33_00990 [Flavobacterium faecale]|uniref:AB hydrolase-1 domain-containing protein n=1 Tax=Flavobacterium faecale TaxID=1355330 RepID=A0A2S1L8W9_9FLAO|nr:alpha/beta hydrolase [Flavobacterium faecale]AWG20199.1 hypothetical protein FFWV33_00990 [Flavobacterium faecale]
MNALNNYSYTDVGQGDATIVFVHYFGGDAGSWSWLIDYLKSDYRCVALDLPGFGNSESLEHPSISSYSIYIANFIEALELENYYLCGHSMGGKLVLYVNTLLKKNLPKKIILIAPSPPTIENMSQKEKERMLDHPNRVEAITTVNNAIKKELAHDRFEYAVESQLKIEEGAWKWWINDGMNESITDIIIENSTPVLLIYSTDDPIIKEHDINKEVLPYLKKVETVALSGIGHLIPMESPEELAALLRDKLK